MTALPALDQSNSSSSSSRRHLGMLRSACSFPRQRKPGPANEWAPRVSDGDLPQAQGPVRMRAAGLGPCAPRDGPEGSPTWALLQESAAPRSQLLKTWPVSVDSFSSQIVRTHHKEKGSGVGVGRPEAGRMRRPGCCRRAGCRSDPHASRLRGVGYGRPGPQPPPILAPAPPIRPRPS